MVAPLWTRFSLALDTIVRDNTRRGLTASITTCVKDLTQMSAVFRPVNAWSFFVDTINWSYILIMKVPNLSCRLIRQMMLDTLLLLALTNWSKCDWMLLYGSTILQHSLCISFSMRARVLWSRQGRGQLLASLSFTSFLRNKASRQLRRLPTITIFLVSCHRDIENVYLDSAWLELRVKTVTCSRRHQF